MSIEIAKNRILEGVPLNALIGESIELKRQSGRLVGRCPFHEEKSGSFTLYDDHYHCFGCGAHGDAISFVRKKAGLGFMEALSHLAEKYSIDAPELKASRRSYAASKQRSEYYKVASSAQAYFTENLAGPRGEKARGYLLERGFKEASIKEFGFGLAVNEPSRLVSHLLSKRFVEKDLLDASLAIKSAKQGRLYDFFQHRLMIPIHDRHGRIIAFGGRTMGDDPAKYKNSRDTEIFDKSNTVFGLHRASEHIRKKKRAIMVEGYMDAMMLWNMGFNETVACMGTAVSLKHLRALSQMTGTLYLLFDGDKAGRSASLRTVSHALSVPSLAVKVASLPIGHDPDSFVREVGESELERLFDAAGELFEYAIMTKLSQAHGLDIPHMVSREFIPWLQSIENNLQRAYLEGRVSELTGISREVISRGVTEKSGLSGPAMPAVRAAGAAVAGAAPAGAREVPAQPAIKGGLEAEAEAGAPLEQPAPIKPVNRLEGEFMGQLYWAMPGELKLEGLESWIKDNMEWDPIWLELCREFISCLINKESPSTREVASWQYASLAEVVVLLDKLKSRKGLFEVMSGSSRQELLDKIKVTQRVRALEKIKQQLKGEMGFKQPDGDGLEEIRLLKEIKKINQELKELARG